MQAKWYGKEVMEKFNARVEKALEVVGSQGVTLVAKKIRANDSVVSSNLVNSISYATNEKSEGKSEITPPEKGAVRIGTRVRYAARVNFGFVGTDSLGRTYNQPAKPFMIALTERKDLLNKIFAKAMQSESGVSVSGATIK